MFVAVVIGGLGSVSGALLGGLIIGIAQAFSPMILPFQLQSMGAFILFLLVLYLRPQGLFGRKARV
jgi:branched-chain amino acid transport system permease protein